MMAERFDGNGFCLVCQRHEVECPGCPPPAHLHAVPDAATVSKESYVVTLPDEFWDSRFVLKFIRNAAHSRQRSADVVLAGVLARLAAMRSPVLAVDTGIGGSNASLNFFSSVVGRSGSGKSSALPIARRLLPIPPGLDMREGLSLGTGEGLCEEYMGEVEEEVEDNGNGRNRTKTRRGQVRNNALFYLDEGQTMSKILERTGQTIGPILRTAWVGDNLGQANASSEKKRFIPAGTYSLGLVIGFQASTAQELLQDGDAGTPQRFLWTAAHDLSIPEELPEWPGELCLDRRVYRSSSDKPMTMDEDVLREIRQEDRLVQRGELVRARLDSHKPLMRIKLAALLALLEDRSKVSREDWELATVIWDTNTHVRDAVLAEVTEAAQAELEAREDQRIGFERRKAAAVANLDKDTERIGRRLAVRLHDSGDEFWNRKKARGGLRSDERGLYDDAIQYAENQGWVKIAGNMVYPGSSRPSDV